MQIDANQTQKTTVASPRSFLDQTLWKRLQECQGEQSLAQAWLPLQCAMISGVIDGAVYMRRPDGPSFLPVAIWPTKGQGSKASNDQSQSLLSAVNTAIKEKKGALQATGKMEGKLPLYHVAYPISVDDTVYAVVALKVAQLSEAHLHSVMRQLQWGGAWFEASFKRTSLSVAPNSEKLTTALELIAVALEQKKFHLSSTAVATELATYFNSDRVSIGFLNGKNIQVAALSHTAEFDKKTNIIRAQGRAMDEAMDQASTVVYPQINETYHVDKAQKELLDLSGAGSICTVPLSYEGEIIGGMCIEHIDPYYFDEEKVALCQHVALLIGPILELQRLESRWIGRKVGDSVKSILHKLFGPAHFTFKFSTLMVLSLLTLMSIVTGTHRVSAKASLEGWVQRHIAAPIDGFIATSDVRAGDRVEKGQRLFTLENKDLLLEQKKWHSQKMQVQKKYRDAFVQRDKAQVGVYRAQLAQADAQLALIAEQLERTEAKAPFDGVVVKGDLFQRLGAPVEKGETLMQIAPLDAYRVIIDVDERDITHLEVGQTGHLMLSAVPNKRQRFSVTKLTPVAVAEEGVNTFRVEALLDEYSNEISPGMQGQAKIEIAERHLIWIWTHRLVDWVRVTLWTWWP